MSQTLSSTREAKEYLIERILTQAKREEIPLSDLERKMLYFTETAWTLPDMEKVSSEFDEQYDQDEYEAKIAALVRGIERDLARNSDDKASWDNAVKTLSTEDHYLLVLIDPRMNRSIKATHSPYRSIKAILILVLVVVVSLTLIYFINNYVNYLHYTH